MLLMKMIDLQTDYKVSLSGMSDTLSSGEYKKLFRKVESILGEEREYKTVKKYIDEYLDAHHKSFFENLFGVLFKKNKDRNKDKKRNRDKDED